MNDDQLYKAIKDIYVELYKQATLRGNFRLTIDNVVDGHLNKFIAFLRKEYREEEITRDFLIRYFEWQFSRYAGVQTKYGSNSILLHWLIGKKAIKAWQGRNVKKNWLVPLKVRKEGQLQLQKAFKEQITSERQIATKTVTLTTTSTEERVKKMYHNTDEGFVWCGTTTSLFNPASNLCTTCIHQQVCIKTLAKHYPNTHKLRIESWQQQQTT